MSHAIHSKSLAAIAAAGVAAMLASSEPLNAHPHAWIDIKVDVLFDDQGNATGLREHWLFDEFYTAFALEGLGVGSSQAPSQEMLDEIVRQNVINLAEYDYFTSVLHGEDNVDFREADGLAATVEDKRLIMSFVVPFEQSLELTELSLTYSVYDPTYYIEMLHADVDEPIQLEGAPEDCSFEVLTPNPSFEAVSLAAALDLNQTASDGLGALFAEQVIVQCD